MPPIRNCQDRVQWLDKARWHGPSRFLEQIEYLIAHDNEGDSFLSSVNYLNTTEDKKASYNYGIERDGRILRMLPVNIEAWACGDSDWPRPIPATKENPDRPNGGRSLNRKSMSICWANKGDGTEDLTAEQLESGLWLFRFWMDKLDIPPSKVLGHYEISPVRKHDPLPAMEMGEWRRQLSEAVMQ